MLKIATNIADNHIFSSHINKVNLRITHYNDINNRFWPYTEVKYAINTLITNYLP